MIQDAKCGCCRPAFTVTVIGERIPDFLVRAPQFFLEQGDGVLIEHRRHAKAPEEPRSYPHEIDYPENPADAVAREAIITKKVLRNTAKKEAKKQSVDPDLIKLGYTWDSMRNRWRPPSRVPELGYVNPTRRAQALAEHAANTERPRNSHRVREGDVNFFGG